MDFDRCLRNAFCTFSNSREYVLLCGFHTHMAVSSLQRINTPLNRKVNIMLRLKGAEND